MKTAHSSTRQLADVLRQSVVDAGANTPSVRGADWRLATVTVVNGDGTVTADGITVRCLESYLSPLVGDIVVIAQASNGNWIAHGRLSGTGISRALQSGTLNMSWTAQSAPTQAVTFPVEFGAIPRVMVNINSGDGAVARWGSRAISISTTGFTAFLFAPTATNSTASNIPVQWIAVAP